MADVKQQPDKKLASLFKAYDVRGVVPDELTPEIAYKIGRALVVYLQPDEVAVGRDMRVSGPALAASLIAGIRDQGANVAVPHNVLNLRRLQKGVDVYEGSAGLRSSQHRHHRFPGLLQVDANPIALPDPCVHQSSG